MAAFDLEKYSTVKERLEEFHAKYPNGRIETELLHLDHSDESKNRLVVIRAALYVGADNIIIATGIAKEREGTLLVNKTSFVENCETSAIGRALANAGFGVDKERPSREEMVAVERLEQEQQIVLSRITEIAKASDEETKNRIRRIWAEIKSDAVSAQALLQELESTHTE
jgi:hypothetical protein